MKARALRRRYGRAKNSQRAGALDREYAAAIRYLSAQPSASYMRFDARELAGRLGVRADQSEDEIRNLVRAGLLQQVDGERGTEKYRPTTEGWAWIAGRASQIRTRQLASR